MTSSVSRKRALAACTRLSSSSARAAQAEAGCARSRGLSDETLLALVDQALPTARRPRVDRHLDGCRSCRRLAGDLIETRTPCASEDQAGDWQPPPAPGMRLGRYRVERL